MKNRIYILAFLFSAVALGFGFRCEDEFRVVLRSARQLASEAAFYETIRLTSAERDGAEEKLSEWAALGGQEFEIELAKPENQTAARRLIEGSDLPVHHKIAAIEGIKEFGRAGGVVEILPPSPTQYMFWDLPAHPPKIVLYELANLQKDVFLHELSHFRDVSRMVENIRGVPRRSAQIKVAQLLGAAAKDANYREWTERTALRSESELKAPEYPYLEKLRALARDRSFTDKVSADPGSPEYKRVRASLEVLAELSLQEQMKTETVPTLRGLSPIGRLRATSPPLRLTKDWRFSTPSSHWKSDSEIEWLEALRKIYNKDLRETRERRATLIYKAWLKERGISQLHPPVENLIRETLEWCNENPKGGSGGYDPNQFKYELDNFYMVPGYDSDPVARLLRNADHDPLPIYERKVSSLLQSIFPDESDEPRRQRALPSLLSLGILLCPNYPSGLDPNAPQRIEAFLLEIAPWVQRGDSVPPWEETLRAIAHTPAARAFVGRIENPRTLAGFRRWGMPVSEPFWAGFAKFLRRNDRMLALREMFAEADWEVRARPVLRGIATEIDEAGQPAYPTRPLATDLRKAAETGGVSPSDREKLERLIADLRMER